jgi:hypothetical protein
MTRKWKPRYCTKCRSETWHPNSPYCWRHSLEAEVERANRRRKAKLSPAAVERERERLRAREKTRPTAKERGYGADFVRRRRREAKVVKSGAAVCVRCSHPILPSQEFDLGHVDHDRTRIAGPEHRHKKDCPAGGNRATNREGRATFTGSWNPKHRRPPGSRDW